VDEPSEGRIVEEGEGRGRCITTHDGAINHKPIINKITNRLTTMIKNHKKKYKPLKL
jgi:hypothetical protein